MPRGGRNRGCLSLMDGSLLPCNPFHDPWPTPQICGLPPTRMLLLLQLLQLILTSRSHSSSCSSSSKISKSSSSSTTAVWARGLAVRTPHQWGASRAKPHDLQTRRMQPGQHLPGVGIKIGMWGMPKGGLTLAHLHPQDPLSPLRACPYQIAIPASAISSGLWTHRQASRRTQLPWQLPRQLLPATGEGLICLSLVLPVFGSNEMHAHCCCCY